MLESEFGTYMRGEFVGVETEGNFSKFLLRVGEPADGRDGFVEKLDFDAYSKLNGSPTLGDDIVVGSVVEVRVWLTSKVFVDKKTNETKSFIGRKVLSVRLVA